jgi:hypothetical protein
MSTDENPDAAPDFLGDKLLYLNAEMPGGFPPEMVEKIERSGGIVDEEDMRAMSKRLIQVRNMLTVGEFFHSISPEHLGDRQATLNELMRVADVGVELFFAVITHRDVTEEVLEEARGEWGPLVDVARKLCRLGPTVI